MYKYTVIVPFYETVDYIGESIQSILNQRDFDISQIQILVIDDGSKFQLEQIIERYLNISNLNIEIHHKQNGN
jgi:glycosyltransferase involved in cell wall biosynthesis